MTRRVLVTLTRSVWPYTKVDRKDFELKPYEKIRTGDGWVVAEVRYVSDQPNTPLNEVWPATVEDLPAERMTAEEHAAEQDPEGRWLTWPPTRELEVGHEYLVRTRTGQQRHPREMRASYLGKGGPSNDSLLFNARPAFGTQDLPFGSIIATMDLGLSQGRDDSRRYCGKVIN